MACEGLTQSINIESTSRFIKLNLRFLFTEHKHGKIKQNIQPNYQPTTKDSCQANNYLKFGKTLRFILGKLYNHFHAHTGFEKKNRVSFYKKISMSPIIGSQKQWDWTFLKIILQGFFTKVYWKCEGCGLE